VVGVSKDPQDVSDRFRESLGLPYPLVGDPDGAILKAYKVTWPFVGLAQRVTYVVARNHKVRLAFHSELDIEAHMEKACGALAAPEA
jgi:peroxiredoxin Q/BCP